MHHRLRALPSNYPTQRSPFISGSETSPAQAPPADPASHGPTRPSGKVVQPRPPAESLGRPATLAAMLQRRQQIEPCRCCPKTASGTSKKKAFGKGRSSHYLQKESWESVCFLTIRSSPCAMGQVLVFPCTKTNKRRIRSLQL